MTSANLAGKPKSGWRDAAIGLRNRIIRDPRFQRFAWTFPLTRWVARRRARALFDLCAGFVYSQILLTCVRLKICEELADGPMSADEIARTAGLNTDAALRLLRAAASLGLLRQLPGDRFALDDLGASLLANPSIAQFVEHHAILYDDLRDPVALLRGEARTRLAAFWPYATSSQQSSDGDAAAPDCGAYCALMSATQDLVAEDILDAYPVRKHRRLLDVGGGEGVFVSVAAARAPDLSLMLFDLPPVAARAGRALAARGLSNRVEIFGGDFYANALPEGADVITLVRILHDHDDRAVLHLLKAAFRALSAGGTLLVAEPMSGTNGAEPIGDAYFGFYLLAMGKGRPRRVDEIQSLMFAAGFASAEPLRTRRPLITSAIIGKKASK